MNIINIFADVVKPIKLKSTGTFNPKETSKITENLSCIKQKDVNLWLYTKAEDTIAIDSGYLNDEYLFKDLESLQVQNENIKAVFLTHADVDHAGGLVSTKRFANKAKVYLNKLELGMLQGKDYRFKFGKIQIKNPISYTGEYETFNDGKIFKIGNIKIECIQCEGHTKGHSAYLVDDTYLFTGDSIAINEDGGYCFFDFYNMNTKTSINSIKSMKEKLINRKPQMVCTSHNGISEFDEAFKNIETVAKASKRKPFDIKAPKDVFEKRV